jgi:uncharacterized protein
MTFDILLTVTATTMIQSIFGVGVLLFGTPALLLLGYEFLDAISVLLPVSVSINALQLIKHHSLIDIKFVKNVLRYSVPVVVLFLLLVSIGKTNISLIIGSFLIFVALKEIFPRIKVMLEQMLHYEKSYLVVMGVVHGLTNLGGSLLTAIAHAKHYSKNKARATIAVCYGLFAVFQLITLQFLTISSPLSYADKATLVQIAVVVFLLTEEFIYERLDNRKYIKLFAVFLFASGCLLIWKAV